MNYLPRSLGSVDVWFLAYLVVILFGVGVLLTVEWIMDARRYLDEAQKSAADLLAGLTMWGMTWYVAARVASRFLLG